jgi:competence protein ComEA
MYKLLQRAACVVCFGVMLAGGPIAQRACGELCSPAAQDAGTAVPSGNPLDINTATIQELKALPGMGDAYARRVVAYRPYTAKNQLVTRGVLPAEVYQKISARIIARRPR